MSKKEFIIVLVLTLIVGIFWFIAERTYQPPTTETDPRLEKALEAVSTDFDTEVLNNLSTIATPAALATVPLATPTPTRTATVSATPVASRSATTATGSATITTP